MKRLSKYWLFSFFILQLLLSFFAFNQINPVYASESSVVDTVYVDWSALWQKVNQHAKWDLEWYNSSSLEWVSVKSDLTIQRSYPKEDTCKITLIFDASRTGNYRLTFGIDARVKNYVTRLDKYQYELTYDEFTVVFDWSDVIGIPNLQFTHGIKEVDGKEYFWFRIRKDNIPKGTHAEIDPTLVLAGSSLGYLHHGYYNYYDCERFWVWCANGSQEDGYIGFKTSLDGVDWSSFSPERLLEWGYFTTWLQEVENKTSYAFLTSDQTQILYRRGTLTTGGTINWDANEQTALASQTNISYLLSTICVDSGGYPWIAYRWANATSGTYYPYVTKSQWNNGSWSTASDFPYCLNATFSDDNWMSTIVPLNSGRMYAVYSNAYGSSGLYGRLWNGTSWQSSETISTIVMQYYDAFSAISIGDDVYIAIKEYSTFDIHAIKRTYDSGWGSVENVKSSTEDDSRPSLSFDPISSTIYCFYTVASVDDIYYKKRVNGVWDTDSTLFVDENYGEYQDMSGGSQRPSFQAYNGKISVIWESVNWDNAHFLRHEYLTPSQSYSRTISQPLTISQTISKSLVFYRSISQLTRLFQQASKASIILRISTQSFSLKSTSTRILSATRSISQSLSISQATTKLLSAIRSINQPLNLQPTAAKITNRILQFSQPLNIKQTVLPHFILPYREPPGPSSGGPTGPTVNFYTSDRFLGAFNAPSTQYFNLTITWSGAYSILVKDVVFEGSNKECLSLIDALPLAAIRETTETEGSKIIRVKAVFTSNIAQGSYLATVKYTFGYDTKEVTQSSVIRYSVTNAGLMPTTIPEWMTIGFLAIIGLAVVFYFKR